MDYTTHRLKHSQSTITDRYGKTSAVTVGDKLDELVRYLCEVI